jgi:uncharacterized protein YuzE
MKMTEPSKGFLHIGYDREADVLYLSLGKPRKGMEYREMGNGVVLRIDPETDGIVGLTVMDFVSNFSGVEQIASMPITGEFVPVWGMAQASEQRAQE